MRMNRVFLADKSSQEMKKHIPFAIVYDFDGTLAPGNMQERDFIPEIGMTKKKFWDEVSSESEKHAADNILMYMKLMLVKASEAKVKVHKNNFKEFGKKLVFFDGVLPCENEQGEEEGWFDRIDEYGRQTGVAVQHFIVSSGIREMVEGTPIAKKFKAIYASSFYYDHNDVAIWPALALNYTSKTQFLFRINKNCLDVHDHEIINQYVPEEDRKIPFKNMVYVGDGDTDIPCFRLVKDQGGHSIAVYKPHTRGAKERPAKLVENGRVNFIAPATYKNGSKLDRIIKALVDKISSDYYVESLKSSI